MCKPIWNLTRSLLVCGATLLVLIPAQTFALQIQTDTISVSEAVQRAVGQDPQVREAQAQLRLARESVEAERLDFLPSLTFSTGSSQRFGLVFDQTAGQLVTRSSRSAGARLSANLTLFDGFEQWSSLRAERATADQRGRILTQEEARVVYQTLIQYLAVIQAREQLRIQEATLSDQQEMQNRVRELVESGALPPGDEYQHEASVASRRVAVLNARRNLTSTKSSLISELGLDPGGSYVFRPPTLPDSAAGSDLPALRSMLERAYEKRPSLQASRAQVDASRHNLQSARSARWPALNLTGSVGTSFTSVSPDPFADQLNENRSGFLDLSLSVPLFQSGQIDEQIAQAEANLESARAQLEAQRRETGRQVREAYRTYDILSRTLEASRARLEAAQRALAATRQRYELGQATFAELQAARDQHVQAQSALAQTRYEQAFQARILQYFVGDLPLDVQFGADE